MYIFELNLNYGLRFLITIHLARTRSLALIAKNVKRCRFRRNISIFLLAWASSSKFVEILLQLFHIICFAKVPTLSAKYQHIRQTTISCGKSGKQNNKNSKNLYVSQVPKLHKLFFCLFSIHQSCKVQIKIR